MINAVTLLQTRLDAGEQGIDDFRLVAGNVPCFGFRRAVVVEFDVAVFMLDQAVGLGADGSGVGVGDRVVAGGGWGC